MINKEKISDELYGLVGLRQPFNPDYAILDADNLESRSNYYANDNPLAKIELAFDSADYSSISNADFNILLKRTQQTAIVDICNQVFDKVDFISRNFLYKNPMNKKNVEILPSGFVGYEIEQCQNLPHAAFEIKRVLLNFKGTGSIKLLLFNSYSDTPIKTQTINITSSNQLVDLNWVVNNTDDNLGGKYFIGYLTDGLTVEPYERNYENANIKSSYKNIEVESVYVLNHNTETLFDLDAYENSALTFGLNFDISEYYDYTDFIITNQNLFARAINIAYTIAIIQIYISSIRSNKNERLGQENIYKALVEIDGIEDQPGSVKKVGLKTNLFAEIKSIRQEISKLQKGFFGHSIKVVTLS